MAIEDVYKGVVELRKPEIAGLVQMELDAGATVESILTNGLISAMDEIGKRFSSGIIYIPEMLRAAQTMKAGLDVLKPFLVKDASMQFGTVVIGSVKGDMHDIGKNLVSMMLEGAGFKVVDIGVDADPEKFIAAAAEHHARVLALSALLTTTMTEMERTVKVIKEKKIPAKVIVGGAPVSQTFADKIGADGYAADAPSAVPLVRRLLNL